MLECNDAGCRLDGTITVENAAAFLNALKPQIANKVPLLDFSGVTHIDSAGLALILSCKRAARAQNYSLRFSGLSDSVTVLAELYGITPLIQA